MLYGQTKIGLVLKQLQPERAIVPMPPCHWSVYTSLVCVPYLHSWLGIAGVLMVVVTAATTAFLLTLNTYDIFITCMFTVDVAIIDIAVVIAVAHRLKMVIAIHISIQMLLRIHFIHHHHRFAYVQQELFSRDLGQANTLAHGPSKTFLGDNTLLCIC